MMFRLADFDSCCNGFFSCSCHDVQIETCKVTNKKKGIFFSLRKYLPMFVSQRKSINLKDNDYEEKFT